MATTNTSKITPAEHLRNELKRREISQADAARECGVKRQNINLVVNGRQAISRALATKLSNLLDTHPDYWLQSEFDDRPPSQQTSSDTPHGIMVDSLIKQAIEKGEISITPQIPENIKQTSIDLTFGPILTDMDGNKIELTEDAPEYVLEPKETLHVHTREIVGLNKSYIARVGGMTNLVRLGIWVNVALVTDPQFNDHLQQTIVNMGNTPFLIRLGDPFLSIEITKLPQEPEADFTNTTPSHSETRKELKASNAVENTVALFKKIAIKGIETHPRKDGTTYAASLGSHIKSHRYGKTPEKAAQMLADKLGQDVRLWAFEAENPILRKSLESLMDALDEVDLSAADVTEICEELYTNDTRETLTTPCGNTVPNYFEDGAEGYSALGLFETLGISTTLKWDRLE